MSEGFSRRGRYLDVTDSQEWKSRGACVGSDHRVFFPHRGSNGLAAKKICAGCEVREECLAYAMESVEQFGIFGGMTEAERRELRRRRERAS